MPMVDSEIVPDHKDWTWVIESRCPECGFDGSTFDPANTSAEIRRNATEWNRLLARSSEELRTRRHADRWSDLEYATHVRDVLRLYLERLELMLAIDDPLFRNWDQDRTAVEEEYNRLPPAAVARQIVSDAELLASVFDDLAADRWDRPGRRSDGAAFTVATFARYLVHDPIHHLWDVRQR